MRRSPFNSGTWMVAQEKVSGMHKILSRETFKAAVFGRDRHRCVVCTGLAVDAHHIMDRKLWPDGGYYLDNGASVCSACHLDCEMTLVSPQALRQACSIATVMLPPGLDPTLCYDKWGNQIMPDGRRLPGPMFEDEGTQRIMSRGRVLHLFWQEHNPGRS
jgi:hypothetical protein